MQPQGGGLAWYHHKARNADHPKAGRGQEQILPGRPLLDFGLLVLRTVREEISVIFKPHSLWEFVTAAMGTSARANSHLSVDVSEPELWVPPKATALRILPESVISFLPAAQAKTLDTFLLSLSLSRFIVKPSRNLVASTLKVGTHNLCSPRHLPCFHMLDYYRVLQLISLGSFLFLTHTFSYIPSHPPYCPFNTPGPSHRLLHHPRAHSPDSRMAQHLSTFKFCSKVTFSISSLLTTHLKYQHFPQHSRSFLSCSMFSL